MSGAIPKFWKLSPEFETLVDNNHKFEKFKKQSDKLTTLCRLDNDHTFISSTRESKNLF